MIPGLNGVPKYYIFSPELGGSEKKIENEIVIVLLFKLPSISKAKCSSALTKKVVKQSALYENYMI